MVSNKLHGVLYRKPKFLTFHRVHMGSRANQSNWSRDHRRGIGHHHQIALRSNKRGSLHLQPVYAVDMADNAQENCTHLAVRKNTSSVYLHAIIL